MSAEVLKVKPACRKCGAKLELDEMHYYDNGNGEASCETCEQTWMDAMHEWKQGAGGPTPPSRP